MTPKRIYFDLAREAIASAGVEDCLVRRPCVILERIARGAGATNWFYCRDLGTLPAIVAWLRPGSMVSFYFDDRIKRAPWTDAARTEVLELIRAHGEIVFGVIAHYGSKPPANLVELDMSLLPTTEAQLAEFASTLRSHQPVFYGEYPDKDHDGVNAVTLVLPDEDGVVRPHPY